MHMHMSMSMYMHMYMYMLGAMSNVRRTSVGQKSTRSARAGPLAFRGGRLVPVTFLL